MTNTLQPTRASERVELLDAMRGFALVGILLANLTSFAGFHLLAFENAQALPAADRAVLFAIDWLVEGKFYALFSVLLGMGFALQFERAKRAKADFLTLWYRRMAVLLAFGLVHLLFIWHGDILTLYSLLGMSLPLFSRLTTRQLVWAVLALLTLPLGIHAVVATTQDAAFWRSSSECMAETKRAWGYGALTSFEMLTSTTPLEVLAANALGAMQRPMAYLQTGRIPQVLGQFLLGLLIARVYLSRYQGGESLPRTWIVTGAIGILVSAGYAWIKAYTGAAFSLDRLGQLQGVIYHAGSTLLVLGYVGGLATAWRSRGLRRLLQPLAVLGRMALSNYVLQSIICVLLFYGYGLAWMGRLSFAAIPVLAATVLVLQWWFSRLWLRAISQGPLEYVWRKLSYPQ